MSAGLPDASGAVSETDATTSRTSSGRALLAATTLMAAGTLISRVLGLLRNSLQISALGGGVKGDIFMMATALPNMAYTLIAGGTLNAILVPLIVRATKEDDDQGEAYLNRIITLFLIIMAVATALCMAFTPWLLRINNPIWFRADHAAYLDNLTALTYLTLPQIFFFGIFFICGQALNARERFGPMMWAPIANNVVAILTFVLYLVVNGSRGDANSPYTSGQIWLLGVGSTLGIVAQAGFMVYYLRATGIRYRPRFDFRGTGLGRTFHVAKWVILTVIVGQLAMVLTNMIANGATLQSEHGAGQAVLSYANLIWMMPHGLITVSITTALLPTIASAFTDHRMERVRAETSRALNLTSAAIIPIAVALIVYAMPIAQLIFGYGRGHDAVPALANTLSGYALGLPFFTAVFVLSRTLYAIEDTRTTLWISASYDALWVLLSFFFVVPFHAPEWTAPAIALAYSVAHIPVLFYVFRLMQSRVPGLEVTATLRMWARLLIAVAPGALIAWFVMHNLLGPRSSKLLVLLALLLTGALAAVLFYGMARVLHIREVSDTVTLITRRFRPGSASGGNDTDTPATPTPGPEQAALEEDGGLGDALPRDRSLDERSDDDSQDDDGHGDGGARPVAGPHAPVAPGGATAAVGGSAGGATAWSPDAADEATTSVPRVDDPPTDGSSPDGARPGGSSASAHGPGSSAAVPREAPESDAATPEGIADARAREAAEIARLADAVAPHTRVVASDGPVADVGAGMVLSGRYRLQRFLVRRGTTVTWQAHDEALSRPVLVHIMRPGDPRAAEILGAARRASAATDSRFLRVLDAVHSNDPNVGALIVCEYAPGHNLESLLASGPLTPLESAWIVRELADALALMHAQGLYHGRLSPDTVVITNGGNVKIVGFGTEAALHPDSRDDARTDLDWAAADVTSLGALLYACLVARWPGEPAGEDEPAGNRLPTAPVRGAHWLSPAQVLASVPLALDQVCDQILARPPRDGLPPLRSAADVMVALARIVGRADATADLEHRVAAADQPFVERERSGGSHAGTVRDARADTSPDVLGDAPTVVTRPPSAAQRHGSMASMALPNSGQTASRQPGHDGARSAGQPRLVENPQPTPGAGPHSAQPPAPVAEHEAAAGGPARVIARRRSHARRNVTLLTGVVGACLLIGLLLTFGNPAHRQPPSLPGTSAQRTWAPIAATGAKDYDPAGSGAEVPGEVRFAIDKDPATVWHTEPYASATFANPYNRKDGVGIWVDLGTPHTVSRVVVTTENSTAFQIRVPESGNDVPATAAGWRTVGEARDAHGETPVVIQPTQTRYVLVWITGLPEVAQGTYQAGIAEIEVDE